MIKDKSKNSISPASPQPFAATKHTANLRDVQAYRRNTRKAQPGCSHETLPLKKGNNATVGNTLKDGQSDTNQKTTFCDGDRDYSASSNNRKYSQRRIYDPMLGSHSIPVVKVSDLLERIVDDGNFLLALSSVRSEPNKACGYDNRTVKDVCDPLLASPSAREKIRQDILHGKYYPGKILTVQIPKANGKMRTLGIATVMDRVVQTMILQAVTANMPENPWSPYSFAYQPKRGVADAIAEVNRIREEGYQYGITMDLKAFFDNVPHDRLVQKLRVHIADKRVVKLVVAFLTPLVIGRHGTLTRNRIGTPQGSVLSPWLASMLYLDELDKEITRRGHRFVRYADDVTVFCHSKQAAKRIRAKLIVFLETTMKCPVNQDKTKIVKINHISLLGVKLERGKWHILRNKKQQACAGYLSMLYEYAKTKNDYYLIKAVQRINGFINHYKRIPGMAVNELLAIKRWRTRRWRNIIGKKNFFAYQRGVLL
ncbi:MAG: hypothetical protein J6Y92_11600 [Lentisphaeria bacterium]|nr:hypothetical protein [Lentisphaeria bacterium]